MCESIHIVEDGFGRSEHASKSGVCWHGQAQAARRQAAANAA